MKMHEYKSNEVQKIITDLETNNKDVGAVVLLAGPSRAKP